MQPPPAAAPDVLEPVHICDIATQLEYSLPRQKAASLVQRHRARSACDAAIHTLHLVETTDSRSRDCEKKAPGVDSDLDSRRQVWTSTRTRYNDGSLECRNECPNDIDKTIHGLRGCGEVNTEFRQRRHALLQ
jgi:hypothetical protein